MGEEYGIYSEFDIEKHKETFVDYLEVIISASGKIAYAVPSHQEMAIALACAKHGVTRDELKKMCPQEYYFDFMTWLLMQTGAMAVWNDFCTAPAPTLKQIGALRRLKMAGLYKGAVPLISERKGESVNG